MDSVFPDALPRSWNITLTLRESTGKYFLYSRFATSGGPHGIAWHIIQRNLNQTQLTCVLPSGKWQTEKSWQMFRETTEKS